MSSDLTSSGELVYAYAVLGSDHAARASGAGLGGTGVAGSTLDLLGFGDLAAVTSEVSTAHFSAAGALDTNGDPAWTAALAMEHFSVVDELFQLGSVLPLRLGTVFRDRQEAAERFAQWHDVFAGALSRLNGCAQWSVRFVTVANGREAEAKPATGTDYLRQARQRQQGRSAVHRQGYAEARRLHESLRGVAVDAEESPVSGEMVLSANYLVRDSDVEQFIALVQQDGLARADLSVIRTDLKGPWAPYSFVPALDEAS